MKSLRQLKEDCPPIPKNAYYYWKDVLENLEKYSGWSIKEFERKINTAIQRLRHFSKKLDEHSEEADIFIALGGAASIGAGVMAVIYSNKPASSEMTAGAAFLGLAGGVTTFKATRAKKRITSSTVRKADEKTNDAWNMITYLEGILSEYKMQRKKAQQQQFNYETSNRKVHQYNKYTSTTEQVVSNVKTGCTLAAGAKDIKCLLEHPCFTGAANTKAAGGTSAIVWAPVGIALGIWDFVEGALAIKNGSVEAKRLREDADLMEEKKDHILQKHRKATSI